MNYGRYFRLNQALSKVVGGVAIYDYIDLPAYFGPSEQNPMSPKYPISVTITSETVCFRLHYSAFKLDKSGDIDFPLYAYDKDIIDKKNIDKSNVGIGMAHMEEIILELPYNNSISNDLSDTIKKIYNSTFPQVIDENTSMGGRFLEQLIKKRYPINKGEASGNDIESQLYQELQRVSDCSASYSSLWLMDLLHDDRINLYSKRNIIDDKTGKSKKIDAVTGFLRKLLLDFMFDLKHSDVFQNSACYQKMLSGLMSDFYFSALMHKCEYYYYRKLIDDSDKRGSLASLDKVDKRRVIKLYVDELAKAEDLWIQDVMNPKSDSLFEYEKQFGFFRKTKLWWKELNSGFHSHQSWFAKPEEEMQRICFTLKDSEGNYHICNTDTLIEYLGIHKNESKEVDDILSFRKRSRVAISKWFLKRYDFNDMVHLHLFDYSNLLYIVASIAILIYLLCPDSIILIKSLIEEGLPQAYDAITIPSLGWCQIVLIMGFLVAFLFWAKESNIIGKVKEYWHPKSLYEARRKIVFKRVSFWVIIQIVAVIIIITGFEYKWLSILAFAALIFYIIKRLVPNLHLLYPRLVAAIATAWMTLAASNDLYAAFFDTILSPLVICGLLLIVLLFVIYEIERLIPLEATINKIFRSIELTIISYTISLVIGAFIINFTGERILERSDIMTNFYDDYVKNETEKKVENNTYKLDGKQVRQQPKNDYERVTNLDKIMVDGKYPIATKIKIKDYTFFFLRDFWIEFSFVAMFIGIFIQMLFEEKGITEM